jgi:hypothetical protein
MDTDKVWTYAMTLDPRDRIVYSFTYDINVHTYKQSIIITITIIVDVSHVSQ